MKIIISEYFYGFIVCDAEIERFCSVESYELIDRGFNFLGEHLGTFKKPIYTPSRYREGQALSKPFLSYKEAQNYSKELKATEVKNFERIV